MKEQLAINTLKKFVDNVDFVRTDSQKTVEKLFVKTEVFASLTFIKEFYHFASLKNIEVIKHDNGEIEIDYTLDNIEDEESFILAFIIDKNRVSSVSKIFDNAIEFENKISDKFGIKFIN